MQSGVRAIVWVIAALLLAIGCSAPAAAGPPSYLVLRRQEAPAKHNQPGKYDAAIYDARTSGYAYGFFGVAPRSHVSRHFGTYRNYTQWSIW
jgi:formate hydrogenlyase subunit 3/multisubunit Na+/H+ antiporter MnhD subunit